MIGFFGSVTKWGRGVLILLMGQRRSLEPMDGSGVGGGYLRAVGYDGMGLRRRLWEVGPPPPPSPPPSPWTTWHFPTNGAHRSSAASGNYLRNYLKIAAFLLWDKIKKEKKREMRKIRQVQQRQAANMRERRRMQVRRTIRRKKTKIKGPQTKTTI